MELSQGTPTRSHPARTARRPRSRVRRSRGPNERQLRLDQLAVEDVEIGAATAQARTSIAPSRAGLGTGGPSAGAAHGHARAPWRAWTHIAPGIGWHDDGEEEGANGVTAPLVSTAWLRERLSDKGIQIVDCRWKLAAGGRRSRCGARATSRARRSSTWTATSAAPPANKAATPAQRGRLRGHRAPSRNSEGHARRGLRQGRRGRSRAPLVAPTTFRPRRGDHPRRRLRAWREDGGELSAGEEQIAAGDFTATASPNDTVTAEELATEGRARPNHAALLDARAPERYGERPSRSTGSRAHPRRGQRAIRRARARRSLPPPDELRARLEAAGARPAATPSILRLGVTAAVIVLAAEVAGIGRSGSTPARGANGRARTPVERG